MLKIITAALLVSAAAAPALAQDATSAPFTGAHIEAIGGWDRVQAGGGHDDGVLYGANAGYDIQRGKVVLGIEGEVSDSTQKEEIGAFTQHAGRDLYAGARIGTVIAGNNLLYAKAGYTNARYSVSGTGTGNTLADGNLDGVRVGAGIEHALNSRAFVKAEYRYSNYEQGVSRNQVLAGVGLRF